MIDRCRGFMGSQEGRQLQRLKRQTDGLFGKVPLEVFGQLFARLAKSRLEKPLKSGIFERAIFADGQHGRSDFGGRDKRFGRNLETQPGLPCGCRQHRERGKIPLTRPGGKLESHLFLDHDQYRPAHGIVQGLEDKTGSDVVGEVGHQMVGGVHQTLLLPVLQRITAYQTHRPRLDRQGKGLAQMLAQSLIDLKSCDRPNP